MIIFWCTWLFFKLVLDYFKSVLDYTKVCLIIFKIYSLNLSGKSCLGTKCFFIKFNLLNLKLPKQNKKQSQNFNEFPNQNVRQIGQFDHELWLYIQTNIKTEITTSYTYFKWKQTNKQEKYIYRIYSLNCEIRKGWGVAPPCKSWVTNSLFKETIHIIDTTFFIFLSQSPLDVWCKQCFPFLIFLGIF